MDRLKRLADEAMKTKNASFMITYNKVGWKVNFNNAGKSFIGDNLGDVIDEAVSWMIAQRVHLAQPINKTFEL